MYLLHVLGHYSVNFVMRKQENRRNNLLRSISLDLHTLTNASVWIHIQLAKFLTLNITIWSPNFKKIMLEIYSLQLIFPVSFSTIKDLILQQNIKNKLQ